jgi:ABC-2 type transport system ATP-binding protein
VSEPLGARATSAPVLLVDDLVVRRAGRRVLDGLALAVGAGEILGVVGPNGAGKSTLLAAVAGLLPRQRGLIRIDGHLVGTVAAQRRLGYVPEAADPPGHLTGDELVALVAALKGAPLDPAVRAALAFAEVAGQRVARMSLGQRRRACLAAALVGAPALLVLDEPSNGLDPPGVTTLVALLAARAAAGAAILLASHDGDLLDRLGARRLALAGAAAPGPR